MSCMFKFAAQMAGIVGGLTALLMLSWGPATACELDGSKEERQRDLRFQEILVEKAANRAEVVATATVSRISNARFGENRELTPVEFRVNTWLKRPGGMSAEPSLVLRAELRLLAVVCLPSVRFYEDQVRVGESVIVYGRAGRVMRAAVEGRGDGEISYERELELLTTRAGASARLSDVVAEESDRVSGAALH